MIPALPQDYDATTLFHYLWWKVRCHEGSPGDFQRLFEDVITRVDPRFVRIRPYGNIGDRKCDGLFFADGVVFQVYSPDELSQAEVVAKIDEDLVGAVKHWRKQGLARWVFVYNVRRGLPPDVPGVLKKYRKKYPWLEIEPLSSDALWEQARALTVQQRAEILGAPSGYDQSFLPPSATLAEIETRLRAGRFMLVQDVMSPIDVNSAVAAMAPDQPFGGPLVVRPSVHQDDWNSAAAFQAAVLQVALDRGRAVRPMYGVFSLAPIPLAVHLGFVLSDRVSVRLFQYDRTHQSWAWPTEPQADARITTTGIPDLSVSGPVDVVVRVSLSAAIRPEDTRAVVPATAVEIDLQVAEPTVFWLRDPAQLTALDAAFRTTLDRIRSRVPNCARIHLFYAGPTGGAITIGQAINPRMTPPVVVYEHSRQWDPRYRAVLTLPGPWAGSYYSQ